ncbi:shikimate dehydrogenase [Streptococcus chenjunshii]|uniref:Shikimate dehydrogenase (NADP(+)) n=1 Tax=Streptococcus chenjunshii TaxID=2173853 RepID=A0A372KMZ8_9STRE|nr:shikimate dehydrogenase [Streptococcus chenjunshii]AXQ79205.1 shikimate dehydrogenase [Streptococcus chenjunshii]RFU50777.1 shikimate dehydrogenase [Streptococcus chenjunshii]RFU52958.1 shikimate dehydrogenase [Streptococcus chenjunshii]
MAERLNGHTLLVSLIATPIRHSLSPTMWNEAFAKNGMDYAYLAFEVGNEQLEDAVKGIRALDIKGSNVSMPNKQKIIPLLDELSPAAEMAGAVNTVVNQNGHLVGHVTDGTGCMRALREEGVEIKDRIVTLTGAGGAGTAIAIQAALDGAKEIRIFNADDEHYATARENARKINEKTTTLATVTPLADQEAFKKSLSESSVYIDATSVGMKPLQDESLITDPDLIRPDLVIFDVVYSPAETKLLRFAREHGAKQAYNGLGMMLYQGAEAFNLITGEEMPIAHVKQALGLD